MHLTGAKIFVRSTNLYTWFKDDYLVYDPEVGASGFTNLATPPTKSIIFGINIKFLMNMKKNILNIFLTGMLLTSLWSCDTDDLDPSLDQDKDATTSITSTDNLYAILKGCYSTMTSEEYYGRDIIVNNEVRTDNTWANGNSGRFTTAANFKYNANNGFCYQYCFRIIQNANLIINTDLSTLSGDLEVGKDYQAQAYALRALAHYDLLRINGQQYVGGTLGIPYKTTFATSES